MEKVKCFIHFMMNPERITRNDKTGKPFDIVIGCTEGLPSLLEMYRTFSPKPASQGLPPQDPETCHNWVKNLFKIGENFLAWRGDSVIGHAALVPDMRGKSGEFVFSLEMLLEIKHFIQGRRFNEYRKDSTPNKYPFAI